jgi:hypothetical protein
MAASATAGQCGPATGAASCSESVPERRLEARIAIPPALAASAKAAAGPAPSDTAPAIAAPAAAPIATAVASLAKASVTVPAGGPIDHRVDGGIGRRDRGAGDEQDGCERGDAACGRDQREVSEGERGEDRREPVRGPAIMSREQPAGE